jgi:cation diffusion facilitator CzcD-associated flavoprotein CzcO
MYTFGFNFKPWTSPKAISPGEDIRNYVTEAATENGIKDNIEFGHKVVAADWCSQTARWTLQIKKLSDQSISTVSCQFYFHCGGYYNYEAGYTPDFTGSENFKGQIIHPQHWPEDVDYSDKHIVVIGSGATAVTLVPTLAKTAASVTMLQRSPTYIASRPEQDSIANVLREYLPAKLAYSLSRWKSILSSMFTYSFARRLPNKTKQLLTSGIKDYLGPDYDVEKHFTPDYKPWDQRVCLVPNGDLFRAIKQGQATVVTDHIDSFTEQGIKLKSGETLNADIIVTATGLKAEFLSGNQLSINGEAIKMPEHFCYKGMMLNNIPNFAFSIGYTNASWTLKSDLIGEYVCRLINHIDSNDYKQCMPVLPAEGIEQEPLLDFNSGYVLRALHDLPKQGASKPWKLYQNYIFDRISLTLGSVTDNTMQFR